MAYHYHQHFCNLQFDRGALPLLDSLDSLVKDLPEQIRSPVEAFKRNLSATAKTASLPYQMAATSVLNREYEYILLEERIAGHRKTHERAHKKFLKDRQLEKNLDRYTNHVKHILEDNLDNPAIRIAASELIRQCAVQLWSALEVVASDIFVTFLNARPDLTIRLTENEKTKKLIQLKGIPIEALAKYQFNLTSNMGNLLVNYLPVDTVNSMKAIFGAILPNPKAINRVLSDHELWRLFQQRHLIVHRRGIVDSSYLSATGDNVPIGSEIAITPAMLKKYMKCVLKAGSAIGAGVVAELKAHGSGPF
jgi:hypothetical protein